MGEVVVVVPRAPGRPMDAVLSERALVSLELARLELSLVVGRRLALGDFGSSVARDALTMSVLGLRAN